MPNHAELVDLELVPAQHVLTEADAMRVASCSSVARAGAWTYACTRVADHEGQHEAAGGLERLVAVWPRR